MSFRKQMKALVVILFLLSSLPSNAQLAVSISPPRIAGQKVVVPFAMRNGFSEKIESARAAVFLTDDQGKMVCQETRWVIGGTQDKLGLAAGATNAFYFVITAAHPFASTNLSATVNFTRIVFDGGKLGDPRKDVQIQSR